MTSIYDKAERFAALHRSGCFTIPNAWDAGSARILAGQGFSAIATTSAGLAFMLGRRDGRASVSQAEALANARDIAEATDCPTSADLEDGYGASPEDCAATVRLAANAGLCGCTIEDTTADPASPIHNFDAAVARIRAAARAARSVTHPFILTARAENFLHGRPDLDDTIRRLVAFAEAGADCLYAPALPDMDAIRAIVAAVSPKPVNVLSGPRDGLVPLSALAAAGVRRVSVGGALARAAYGQLITAGQALRAGDLPGALHGVASHAAVETAIVAGE
jgi:2-methylisocitrate lyase-like PEP mutase family enzyme